MRVAHAHGAPEQRAESPDDKKRERFVGPNAHARSRLAPQMTSASAQKLRNLWRAGLFKKGRARACGARIAGRAAILYPQKKGKGALFDMRAFVGCDGGEQGLPQWNQPKGDSNMRGVALDCSRSMRVGNAYSLIGFAVPGLACAASVARTGLFLNSTHRFEARVSEIP